MKLTTTFILAAAIAVSSSTAAPAQNRPQAERITNGPVIEGTGNSWAVIAWTTDTGGSTVVHYGIDRNRLSQTAEAPYSDNERTQGQNHRVRLRNLQPGTTYYYRVDSGQGEGTGTEAMSPILTFTTKGGGDRDGDQSSQAERIIEGPTIQSTGSDAAEVVWTTNTGGSSIVRYGTDRNHLTQVAEAPYSDNEGAQSQTHRVRLRNLQPGTIYYYRVDSGQGEGTGTEAMSPIQQFTAGAAGNGSGYGSGSYRPSGQGYNRDGRYGGANSGDPAAQIGYQDGLNDGSSARQSGQGSVAAQQQAYQHADHNYSPAYGDRQQYKDTYRQAYEAGFQRGYNGRDQGFNERGAYGTPGGYQAGVNPAQQVGYQDGLNDGSADRESGHSSRVTEQQAYQHADHNYSPAYGDRQQYKDAYRQAYQQGYQQGYNGAPRR